jgi:hypothetical protein
LQQKCTRGEHWKKKQAERGAQLNRGLDEIEEMSMCQLRVSTARTDKEDVVQAWMA